MELVIGTKKWSSWSLRPWLAIKRVGAPFTETVTALREHDSTEVAIKAAGSPSGLVPILKDDGVTVWDSLAICEYLADKYPQARLWPVDLTARALARSAAAEMHSGFHSLRGECSMDLSMEPRSATLSEATHRDIRRIVELWNSLRETYADQGPFLLGEWSIADAFYTPVATRFSTYGVQLSDFGDRGEAGRYCETLLDSPDYKAWASEAKGAEALGSSPRP